MGCFSGCMQIHPPAPVLNSGLALDVFCCVNRPGLLFLNVAQTFRAKLADQSHIQLFKNMVYHDTHTDAEHMQS